MKRCVWQQCVILPAMFLGLTLSLQGPGLSNGGHQHPGAAAPAPLAVGAPIFIPKESQFLLGIRTAVATERTVTQQITTQGKIIPKPQNIAELFTPHAGRIVDAGNGIPQVGQWVERGQALAAIEQVLSAPERLSVKTELAKVSGELAQAQVEVRLAEQETGLARKNLERLRSISAVVAGKEILAAELEYQKARGKVASARAGRDQLLRQRAYYQDLNNPGSTQLGRYVLTAPLSGVVTEVHAVRGEQVNPDRPLFEIIDSRIVWVESNLYEDDLPLVRQAKSAAIAIHAYPGMVHTGHLISLSPKLEAQTRTAKALFEIPNRESHMHIGMYVTLSIPTKRLIKRVTIPAAAVYEQGGNTWVFVHTTAETFQQHTVTVSQRVGDLVVVQRGVQAGERVVVQGAHQLFAVAARGAAPSPAAEAKK